MLAALLLILGVALVAIGLIAALAWAFFAIILRDDNEEIEDDACFTLFEAHRDEKRELSERTIVPERGHDAQIVGDGAWR